MYILFTVDISWPKTHLVNNYSKTSCATRVLHLEFLPHNNNFWFFKLNKLSSQLEFFELSLWPPNFWDGSLWYHTQYYFRFSWQMLENLFNRCVEWPWSVSGQHQIKVSGKYEPIPLPLVLQCYVLNIVSHRAPVGLIFRCSQLQARFFLSVYV